MSPAASLLERPSSPALVSDRTPGGQWLTAVRVPGARTVEMRVSLPLVRRSDGDAAHSEVLARCLLADPGAQRELGVLGTDAAAGASPGRLTVAAAATVDGWQPSLRILAGLLTTVAPTAPVLRLACGAAARGAMHAVASPALLGRAALHRLIWGSSRPSRFDVPSPEALGEVSQHSLERFARHRLATAPAHVVVCGPRPARETWHRTVEALAAWRLDHAQHQPVALPAAGAFGCTTTSGGPAGRALVRLMFPAPRRDDPGYATARLSAAVLAGGPASRLHRRLRDERGLVYSVSHATETVARDVFDVIEVELRDADVSAATDEITAALTDLPTEAEVARARRRVLGAQLVSRSSVAATAGSLADLTSEGLAPTWPNSHATDLAAATTDDVRSDANRRLRPGRGWGVLVTADVDSAPPSTATTGEHE